MSEARRLSSSTYWSLAILAGAAGLVALIGPWIWASTLNATETGSVGSVIMAGLACGVGLLIASRMLWVAATDAAVLARDRDPAVRLKATARPTITQDQLDHLRADPDKAVRDAALAKHVDRYRRRPLADRMSAARGATTPLDELEILVGDPDDEVRLTLARNEHIPPEIRVALTRDGERRVRSSAADPLLMNFRAGEFSDAQWHALATSEFPDVRTAAANNYELPETELARLARDRDASVRRALAANSASSDALTLLGKDRDEDVRLAVAENHATPLMALARLADDRSPAVRDAVVEHLSRFGSMKYDTDSVEALAGVENDAVRCAVADGVRCMAPAVIESLASDPSPDVRGHLATALGYRTDLPVDVLWRLARSSDPRIRKQSGWYLMQSDPDSLSAFGTDAFEMLWEPVASHVETPADVLARLAERGDNFVRRNVASNPNTPASTLAFLANRRNGPPSRRDSDESAFMRAVHSGCGDEVVVAVAKHVNTPPDTLKDLASDRNSEVRCAVARNPNTPAAVLETLAVDPDDKVRHAARDVSA